MRRSYSNAPRWMEARFPSQCTRCKCSIKKGDRIFYYPASKAVYCAAEACGKECSRDFESHAFDEANNCSM